MEPQNEHRSESPEPGFRGDSKLYISLHSRGCHFWPTSFKFGGNVNFCNGLDNFVGQTNKIVFTLVLGSFPKYFGFGAPRRISDGVSPQISIDIIEIIFLYKFKAYFLFVLAGYIMLSNVYFTFSLCNHTLIQICSNSIISNNESLMKDDFSLSNHYPFWSNWHFGPAMLVIWKICLWRKLTKLYDLLFEDRWWYIHFEWNNCFAKRKFAM